MKFAGSAGATVARTLLTLGPSTAVVLAEELGLTGTAIRKTLDALIEQGFVEATERAPYGPAALAGPRGRGRPARVFNLTPAGKSKFGAHEDSLAVAAVKFMATVAGPQSVNAFAEQIAADFKERHSNIAQLDSIEERAMALADALNAEGFAAVVTPGLGGSTQICQNHCPMGDVAIAFPHVCEAETEAFSELTGVHVTRLATIAGGSPVCTTLVPHTRRDTA